VSANSLDRPITGREKAIFQALIDRCGLTSDVVESIMQARKTLGLDITEAAVHIGMVTAEDITEALEYVRTTESSDSTGIIETAVRIHSRSRVVAVRHREMVTPSGVLILAHDMDNERSERIRALRTELLILCNTGERANVMALMSPQSGEGRSQLSAELAIAFSQLGRRTLLVDGDLRNPRQHALFNAPNHSGLAQALQTNDLPKVYGVVGLPHLSLVTAGPIVPNPLELLSGGHIDRLIADWRYEQEFVVIDTPPTSQFADGLAIAMMAEHVLILSRSRQTNFSAMKDMVRRLTTTQSRILGAVINNF
jgi:protein-tyrosine kinase